MSFSMAGRGARGPEINVTPLIDVLLTLIIVFMVAVSMDKEQGESGSDSRTRSKTDGGVVTISHRDHSSGVDEGRPTADRENQSGRRAVGRSGDAPG